MSLDEERVFYCPSRGTAWCSEVPNYATWINYVSITPTEGGLGDSITVEGKLLWTNTDAIL